MSVLIRKFGTTVPRVVTDDQATAHDGLAGGAPLAHWQMSDSSGNFQDRKAGARHVTANGTVVYSQPALPQNGNSSVDFAGTGYGELAHDSGLLLPAFTISFWLKPNRLPTSEEGRFALISKDLTGINEGDMTIWMDSNGDLTVQFQSASSQFPLSVSADMVAGERYHIAVRADSTGFDVTVNGQILGKRTDYTSAWSLQTASQPLRFGAVEWLYVDDPETPGTWPVDAVLLDGVLDEISLYARALTDAEILELSQYDTPPVASNDSFVVQEQTTNALDITNNDSFVGDKADLAVEIVAQPSLGSATVRSDNDVDYSAGAVNQQESDSFTYKITDSIGESPVATASIIINDTTTPGSGDGFGGDLIYVWQPQLSWITGVPLADRAFNNALNLSRFTDPDATAGSSRLPFSGAVGGGGSVNSVCFTRAPTGHPAMEIKNSDGHNSGGIDWDIRFWEASAGIRHVRIVMEARFSHPSDPTTFIGEGLFSSLSSYPDWFDSIQGGGKLLVGLHCNSAGASCKYNWYAKPEFPTTTATYRIGWGTPIAGTSPGFRAIMPLDISWNRPQACEAGPIETAQAEHTRISTLGERWTRLELEVKLCSPGGTPSNATEGNTGFGGSSGTASNPGPGDGFTKVFITRDVDGELGSPGSRVNTGHIRGAVSFPRPTAHLNQSIREILFTMWYGGTGSGTYPIFESPVFVRKVEMYHYAEDDI